MATQTNSCTRIMAHSHTPQKKPNEKNHVSHEEAIAAVKTLLAWSGDNPDREGLQETPSRVVKAFGEYFAGYQQDPATVLAKTFSSMNNYQDLILLKDIPFTSHCEHHIQPFYGHCHIAYYPKEAILGISKLARLVDIFAKRLQTQESLTMQIAHSLQTHLNPKGCAVFIKASHQCMRLRGVKKSNSELITFAFTGIFEQDKELKKDFFSLLES